MDAPTYDLSREDGNKVSCFELSFNVNGEELTTVTIASSYTGEVGIYVEF